MCIIIDTLVINPNRTACVHSHVRVTRFVIQKLQGRVHQRFDKNFSLRLMSYQAMILLAAETCMLALTFGGSEILASFGLY